MAAPGFNLLSSCELLNMQGEIVQVFPGFLCTTTNDRKIISQVGNYLYKFDRNLNVIWRANAIVHHDYSIGIDGHIFALGTEIRKFQGETFHFNTIVKILPDGKISNTWKSFEHIDDLHKLTDIDLKNFNSNKKAQSGDVPVKIKINSIHVIPENSLSNKEAAFRKGNLLVGFSQLNLLAILDPESFKILWSYSPPYRLGKYFSHSAQMLAEGKIILFNNTFSQTPSTNSVHHSAILKLDPLIKNISWEYRANPPDSFYSPTEGDVQQLENGNILITENTMGGTSYEINTEKEIVWKWINPRINPATAKPYNIYRMRRIQSDLAAEYLYPQTNNYVGSLAKFNREFLSINFDTIKTSWGTAKNSIYKNNDELLEIEEHQNIEKSSAVQIEQNKLELLSSFFQKKDYLYPTMLVRSQRPDCKFNLLNSILPNNHPNVDKTSYLLYANEYYSYGTCNEKDKTYLSLITFLYCANKKSLFMIKYFSKKYQNIHEHLESISCPAEF